MSRYDKYDSENGGFRAALAANLTLTSQSYGPIGVGLDANGRVVAGSGNTGIVGVLVKNMPVGALVGNAVVTGVTAPGAMAGDIVDVMTDGEIVEFTSVAGTAYYADNTTGVISSTGGAGKTRVGHSVEAGRLVVRLDRGDSTDTDEVTGGQAAIADVASANAVSPANAVYTQADQTALADLANELKTKFNTLLAELRTGGELLP